MTILTKQEIKKHMSDFKKQGGYSAYAREKERQAYLENKKAIYAAKMLNSTTVTYASPVYQNSVYTNNIPTYTSTNVSNDLSYVPTDMTEAVLRLFSKEGMDKQAEVYAPDIENLLQDLLPEDSFTDEELKEIAKVVVKVVLKSFNKTIEEDILYANGSPMDKLKRQKPPTYPSASPYVTYTTQVVSTGGGMGNGGGIGTGGNGTQVTSSGINAYASQIIGKNIATYVDALVDRV